MHLFGVCLMDGVFAVADSSAVFEHGSAANGQSGGLGEGCGLLKILQVSREPGCPSAQATHVSRGTLVGFCFRSPNFLFKSCDLAALHCLVTSSLTVNETLQFGLNQTADCKSRDAGCMLLLLLLIAFE